MTKPMQAQIEDCPIAIVDMTVVTHVKQPIFRGKHSIGQMVDDMLDTVYHEGKQVNSFTLTINPDLVKDLWTSMIKDEVRTAD